MIQGGSELVFGSPPTGRGVLILAILFLYVILAFEARLSDD